MSSPVAEVEPSVKPTLAKSEIEGASDYELVTDEGRAWEIILNELPQDEVAALDFETTGLSPDDSEVRLSCLRYKSSTYILDHFACGRFAKFAKAFSERSWAVFNAGFDGSFIDYEADNIDVKCYDVGTMRKAKLGGGALSLAIMAKRDLKITLDKSEQNSGWWRPKLTKRQYDYAAYDADVTWWLWEKWSLSLTKGQWHGFLMVNSAWRGTKQMEETGLHLDVAYHKELLKLWELKRDTAERYLRKWVPTGVLSNLNSKPQISAFFKDHILDADSYEAWPKTGKRKQLDLTRDRLREAAHRLPYPHSRWVAALIIFNKMNKYISTYGQKLIDSQERDGKVSSRFNIAQAITCRYSSSAHNLQNIPNSVVVRRSFVADIAEHLGLPSPREHAVNNRKARRRIKRLIIADYSSIEVRVLAELSKDEGLLYDAIYGDVHSASAAQIFGIELAEFLRVLKTEDPELASLQALYKSYRTKAKAFTFQLLYGAGAAALAMVLGCSDEEAEEAIDAWARLYPKAFAYRQQMFDIMMDTGFLPVTDGRTIYVFKDDRAMPVAANYPVQGAAASVMYRAVHHTHRLIYLSGYEAALAATVHDELLSITFDDVADAVAEIQEKAMIQAWLDIFPDTDTNNLIGDDNLASIASHWGEK